MPPTLDDIDARYRYRLRAWIGWMFVVELLLVGRLHGWAGHEAIVLIDAGWVACLLAVLVAVHRFHASAGPGDALVLVNAVFASINMHVAGINGLGWVFPIIITAFAISRPRLALVVSIAMLVNAFAFTGPFGAPDAKLAFGLCGALITVLSYVVARHVETLRHLLGRLATRDPLTDSGNRRAMDDALRSAIRARHAPSVLAVLDLDHCKKINDAYGHAAGDRVLRETAAAIRSHLGDSGRVYRLGGEEFVVLLPATSRGDAGTRLRALGAAIRRDVRLREVQITCSIGYAAKRPIDDAATWLARADSAMHRAKTSGRDRVVDVDDPLETNVEGAAAG
ncbi:GGDEF domain-containing protein [Lysobacter claricitrinus]|uniref:GGDEF domain-containing protein n=1 Tax=Lysobacter claricitrinus TaxID=3367728 RepID=UPI0038B2856E